MVYDTVILIPPNPANAGLVPMALTTAAFLTCLFIAVAFTLTATLIELFGYSAAGALWVFIGIVAVLSYFGLGYINLVSSSMRSIARGVFNAAAKFFGFGVYYLDKSKIIYAHGTRNFFYPLIAISIGAIAYYGWLAGQE